MEVKDVNSEEDVKLFVKEEHNKVKRTLVKTLGTVAGVAGGYWIGPEIVDYIGSGQIDMLWNMTESIIKHEAFWDLGSRFVGMGLLGVLGNYASKKLGNYLIK